MLKRFVLSATLVFFGAGVDAATVVGNVTATQRPWTRLVDIAYDVSSDSTNAVSVSVVLYVRDEFDTVVANATGDVGQGVSVGAGKKAIIEVAQIGLNAGAGDRNLTDYAVIGIEATDGSNVGSNPPSGSDMVLVPIGKSALSGEIHRPLYVDVYEVTKSKWDEVYAWAITNGYAFENAGSGKGPDHPVHSINWYDCVKWCNARSEMEGLNPVFSVSGNVYRTGVVEPELNWYADGYRLLSRNEWTHVGRGGETQAYYYPWGSTIAHSQANYYSTTNYSYDISTTRGYHPNYASGATPYTSPVGAFQPNGYGLYDVIGNIYEWCVSRYDEVLQARAKGGSWNYMADRARFNSTWLPQKKSSYNYLGLRTSRVALRGDGCAVSSRFHLDTSVVALVVESDFGHPIPAIGTNSVAGGVATCSVENVVMVNGTNYYCWGWIGSGSVPVHGMTNTTGSLSLTAAISMIRWIWDADIDNDKLPDGWEQQIADADPEDGITSIWDVLPSDDFDGDGWSNLAEYGKNTDPLSATHFFPIGDHPVASRSAHKEIHVLHPWNGRLYMGAGDWNERPGPIPLISYKPSGNRFVVEHCLGTDSVGLFREIGGRLYVPSIDPAHFRETTDFSYFDGTNWVDHTSLGFYHLFDLATLSGTDLWAAGSKSAVEGASGGATLSRSLDGGKTWTDFTPPNSYSRYYWMFEYQNKMYVQGQCFNGSIWQPSSLSEIYFNKAAKVQGLAGEVVLGRTGRAPAVVADARNIVKFDGAISAVLLAGTFDFTIYSNRVYAIQADGESRNIVVCEDPTIEDPVWFSVGLGNVPPDASSIAIMDDIVYIGTSSGSLYAVRLPGSFNRVILPVASTVVEQPDRFGSALASSGNWLAVGAPHEAGMYPENGAVHLFKDATGSGEWMYDMRLAAPESAQSTGRYFGDAIAFSGNRMAVPETGTPSIGPNRGECSRIYIYKLGNDSWSIIQQMTNAFVQSVCMEGDWLVLGAKDFAKIYRWNGAIYEETQTIGISISAFSWPLVQVDIVGSRLFVGIMGDTTLSAGAGAVQEYGLNDSGLWIYRRTFDSRKGGSTYPPDGFARAISADATGLAIGAPRDDEMALQAGVAYVVDFQSLEMKKILPPEPEYGQGFGTSVLLDGDDLFVGVTGATNATGNGAVYRYYRLNGNWIFVGKNEPVDCKLKCPTFDEGPLMPPPPDRTVPLRF